MTASWKDATVPWLRGLCAALGLAEAEQQRCLSEGGLLLGDVPVMWSPTATGGNDHLVMQALIGPMGPSSGNGPLLEMALHAQMLLCGPGMPVFALDAASRNLMLLHAFSTSVDAPSDAAAVVRTMHAMAQQWRAVIAEMEVGRDAPRKDTPRTSSGAPRRDEIKAW